MTQGRVCREMYKSASDHVHSWLLEIGSNDSTGTEHLDFERRYALL